MALTFFYCTKCKVLVMKTPAFLMCPVCKVRAVFDFIIVEPIPSRFDIVREQGSAVVDDGSADLRDICGLPQKD